MRGGQIPLDKMQKLRLERALEHLESLSSKANSNASGCVADTIPVNFEDGVLKGHGTSEIDGHVVATVCGVVERVNKLVYVRVLRARYKPEVGDIIVGRVIERRRTAVDELNMRSIFEENDFICAEVRGFQPDGLHLQARSQKYGKLERGQSLSISHYLVKRHKQHFHHLDQYGIDLILGFNGFIWVGEHVEAKDDMVVDQINISEQERGSVTCEKERSHTPLEVRQYICRVANAVKSIIHFRFHGICGSGNRDSGLEHFAKS